MDKVAGVTRVRYTMNGLGLIRDPGTVNADDEGTYLGVAPDPGWYLTEPDQFPGRICPVSADMFEVAL